MTEAIRRLWLWCRQVCASTAPSPHYPPKQPGEWYVPIHPRSTRPEYGAATCRTPAHTHHLDGDASALVRPYLLHAEQQQRRHELEFALDGIDVPGPMWIHGTRVEAVA